MVWACGMEDSRVVLDSPEKHIRLLGDLAELHSPC